MLCLMIKNKEKLKELLALSLIIFSVLSRLFPHPPNFTPLTAIALFGAFSFRNKIISFLVPLIAMLLSDLIIGFHSTIWAVYLSFALIVFIGFLLRKSFSFGKLFLISSCSSFLFYIITNFAVWLTSGMYTRDLPGLIQCYVVGLPFYRTTPLEFFALSYIGDLSYSFIIFGAYFLAEKYLFFPKKI